VSTPQHWHYEDGAWINDALSVALFNDDDSMQFINWFMWSRWFHNNTGIGNSWGVWWPSRKGPHSAWVLCDRCGLPFEIPTGLFVADLWRSKGRGLSDEIQWTGGPCTHCKAEGEIATGTPLLAALTDDAGRAMYAASEHAAIAAFQDTGYQYLLDLSNELRLGSISVEDAVFRLRNGPGSLGRIADWLERRPVTTAAAGVVLTAVASLVGPQLAARPDDSADDQKIVEIIDTILDHYDERERERRTNNDAPHHRPRGDGRKHDQSGR
jgi:hypothetical protein